MAMTLRSLFAIDKHAVRGLLAVEWIAIAYLLFTVVIMAVQWDQLVNTEQMVKGRLQFLLVTLAVWGVYRLLPCPLILFLRIAVQMVFLSWWYPDTYELNRMLPNLDHVFAGLEQQLFGCQPSLLFSQKLPWGWFSELMCMGYVSYFPLMSVLLCILRGICPVARHRPAVLLPGRRYRQHRSGRAAQRGRLVPDPL